MMEARWPSAEALADGLCEINRRQFLGRDTVDPMPAMIIAESAEGEVVMISIAGWRNNVEKALLLGRAKRQLRKAGATRYAFVHEAWLARRERLPDGSAEEGPMPSEDPHREEVVMTLVVEPGRPFLTRQQLIVRDAAGVVTELVDQDMTGWQSEAFGPIGELLGQRTTEH